MNLFSTAALIPARGSFTTGSQFIANNMNIKGKVREQNILNEFMAGNIPDLLRAFKPLTINDSNGNTITILVMSDYLSIGTDQDYCRMPMFPATAQKIADKFDCSLPTKKLVDEIYKASFKITAKPWGPPYSDMDNTNRYGVHNNTINKQIDGMDKAQLIAGHKKDIVLTNKIPVGNPGKRVAIYGWFLANGQPIQGPGPNAKDHDDQYVDYSHGARLISNDVMLNNDLVRLQDVFGGKYSSLLSDEGPLKFLKY